MHVQGVLLALFAFLPSLARAGEYACYLERINDSNHKAILHIDSPADSDVWREGISLPKPYIEFEEDVYYETMVIIGCGSDEQNQNLFKSFTG